MQELQTESKQKILLMEQGVEATISFDRVQIISS